MARITVEDCLKQVPNRFELVLVAARRAKLLLKGARPLVESDNKEVVSALREVGAGKVSMRYPKSKKTSERWPGPGHVEPGPALDADRARPRRDGSSER